ncbi:MAG: SDR family NAD(P)-dependent oxidoreductase [Planctomycetota bacterium]|nr:MAG: SDR family NAD(P)-dependent oxidoreductase [Planctomycetota bacterium]REK49450.1 MAG: SDR family NAD(P)-dependent oxidoreductase [Planctomycetota bacterium]
MGIPRSGERRDDDHGRRAAGQRSVCQHRADHQQRRLDARVCRRGDLSNRRQRDRGHGPGRHDDAAPLPPGERSTLHHLQRAERHGTVRANAVGWPGWPRSGCRELLTWRATPTWRWRCTPFSFRERTGREFVAATCQVNPGCHSRPCIGSPSRPFDGLRTLHKNGLPHVGPRDRRLTERSHERVPRMSDPRFAEHVVLVTGASDRGIGGAIASRLASEGASLALVSPERPEQLLAELAEIQSEPARSVWIECDFLRDGDIEKAAAEVADQFAQLDVLVNNSGIDISGNFADLAPDQWQRLLDVNLTGALRMTQAVLPQLLKRRGNVVNIASASGLAGTPGLSGYGTTKAGLVGLTQTLAAELAPQRVRVNAVCPALVHTPMAEQYVKELTSEIWDRIQACHPLGIGAANDVAAAVAFLASAEARWITGVALPLGWVASYPLPVQFEERPRRSC